MGPDELSAQTRAKLRTSGIRVANEQQRVEDNIGYYQAGSSSRISGAQRRMVTQIDTYEKEAISFYSKDLEKISKQGALDAGFTPAETKAYLRTQAKQGKAEMSQAATYARKDTKKVAGALREKNPDGTDKAIRQRGVKAARYRDGRRFRMETYGDMAVRTRSALVYNHGAITAGAAQGIKSWQIVDGPGCGLTSHSDSQKANGMIVNGEEALQYLLAHPNCQRRFVPASKKRAPSFKNEKKAASFAKILLGEGSLGGLGRAVAATASRDMLLNITRSPEVRQRAYDITSKSPVYQMFTRNINQLLDTWAQSPRMAQIIPFPQRFTPDDLIDDVISNMHSWAVGGEDLLPHVRYLTAVDDATLAPVQIGDKFADFNRYRTLNKFGAMLPDEVARIMRVEDGFAGRFASAATHALGRAGAEAPNVVRFTLPSATKVRTIIRPHHLIRYFGTLDLPSAGKQLLRRANYISRESLPYDIKLIARAAVGQDVRLNPNGLVRLGFRYNENRHIIPSVSLIPKGPIRLTTRLNRGTNGMITSATSTARLITPGPFNYSVNFYTNLRALGLESLWDARHLRLDDILGVDWWQDSTIRSLAMEYSRNDMFLRLGNVNVWEMSRILRIPWEDAVKLWNSVFPPVSKKAILLKEKFVERLTALPRTMPTLKFRKDIKLSPTILNFISDAIFDLPGVRTRLLEAFENEQEGAGDLLGFVNRWEYNVDLDKVRAQFARLLQGHSQTDIDGKIAHEMLRSSGFQKKMYRTINIDPEELEDIFPLDGDISWNISPVTSDLASFEQYILSQRTISQVIPNKPLTVAIEIQAGNRSFPMHHFMEFGDNEYFTAGTFRVKSLRKMKLNEYLEEIEGFPEELEDNVDIVKVILEQLNLPQVAPSIDLTSLKGFTSTSNLAKRLSALPDRIPILRYRNDVDLHPEIISYLDEAGEILDDNFGASLNSTLYDSEQSRVHPLATFIDEWISTGNIARVREKFKAIVGGGVPQDIEGKIAHEMMRRAKVRDNTLYRTIQVKVDELDQILPEGETVTWNISSFTDDPSFLVSFMRGSTKPRYQSVIIEMKNGKSYPIKGLIDAVDEGEFLAAGDFKIVSTKKMTIHDFRKRAIAGYDPDPGTEDLTEIIHVTIEHKGDNLVIRNGVGIWETLYQLERATSALTVKFGKVTGDLIGRISGAPKTLFRTIVPAKVKIPSTIDSLMDQASEGISDVGNKLYKLYLNNPKVKEFYEFLNGLPEEANLNKIQQIWHDITYGNKPKTVAAKMTQAMMEKAKPQNQPLFRTFEIEGDINDLDTLNVFPEGETINNWNIQSFTDSLDLIRMRVLDRQGVDFTQVVIEVKSGMKAFPLHNIVKYMGYSEFLAAGKFKIASLKKMKLFDFMEESSGNALAAGRNVDVLKVVVEYIG